LRPAQRKPSMSNKLLKVRFTNTRLNRFLTYHLAVIARQALAQEEVGEFNSDFPETIPIDLKGNEGGCAC